ncbi:CTD kinase subunit gamma CTK3-domain-containing protein [Lipomyces oligophaga]|uniref:CTD kinase subunit gamma CTK3-domain-containing protein n=1 Tax=Lipomyces oligophaga TaxID=45792 RepID=UPI0034CF27A9
MPLDAFEARLTFTELLRHLNASVQSAMKCAQFAIRYQDLSEDLYSCIVEELDQSSLNSRINILYFLETLCESSLRSGADDYVQMIKRDLKDILEKVVPKSQGSQANIALARKALENLRGKAIINDDEVTDLESILDEREISNRQQKANAHFTRIEILERMDEDRERHKRLRENIWVIPSGDAFQIEFEEYWNTTSDLGEDDYDKMQEENELMQLSCTE